MKARLRYSSMTKDVEIDDVTEELRIEPPITVDVAHDSVGYRCDVFRFVETIDDIAIYEFVGTD